MTTEFPQSLTNEAVARWHDFTLHNLTPESIEPLCTAHLGLGLIGATWTQDGKPYQVAVEYERQPLPIHWAELVRLVTECLSGKRSPS